MKTVGLLWTPSFDNLHWFFDLHLWPRLICMIILDLPLRPVVLEIWLAETNTIRVTHQIHKHWSPMNNDDSTVCQSSYYRYKDGYEAQHCKALSFSARIPLASTLDSSDSARSSSNQFKTINTFEKNYDYIKWRGKKTIIILLFENWMVLICKTFYL